MASSAAGLRTGSKPTGKLEPNVHGKDDSPVFDSLNITTVIDSERATSKLPSDIRRGLKRLHNDGYYSDM